MKKINGAGIAFIVIGLLVSCQSLGKDLFINTSEGKRRANLAELERAVVALDNPESPSDIRQNIAAARKTITEMEKESAADTEYTAALAAFSGRLSLLEGKSSDALRDLRRAHSLSPGNIQERILAIRLERDTQKRLEIIDRELKLEGPAANNTGAALLQIERGRTLMDLLRFSEAAGAFDTAFAGDLDSIYRETYRVYREKAWELRDTGSGTDTIDIMTKPDITWKDFITLAKKETQVLRFITAGRDMSEAEIFRNLQDRSFIPYTQDAALSEWPAAGPDMNEKVTRAGAAWLLWRLYAENRADRGLLSRYSARYASRPNQRSPIADIHVLSPFFDSILGCVESEFMSLPDGKNFNPGELVRPAEILAGIKKIN
ncbi:MAG: hypothetical protein LBN21_01080 [Treponema sp.]|nr:hypothetical protein [Treponema sp.]